MRTLNGLTYAQLFTLTADELNEYQAVFTTNEIRSVMHGVIPIGKNGQSLEDKFLEIMVNRLAIMFKELFNEEHYAMMRVIYDTEEKFNFSSDLAARLGNIGMAVQSMMNDAVLAIEWSCKNKE